MKRRANKNSGRRVSCSRRWSRIRVYSWIRARAPFQSPSFSLAAIFILDRRYRRTAIMREFQRSFVLQNFPDEYNTFASIRAEECTLQNTFENEQIGQFGKSTRACKTTLSDCTILRNTNSVNVQSRILYQRGICDKKVFLRGKKTAKVNLKIRIWSAFPLGLKGSIRRYQNQGTSYSGINSGELPPIRSIAV